MGAGMMWMGATKQGRETRDKLLDAASDVYADIAEKVVQSDAYKNLTKQKFTKLVQETVDKYAKDNPFVAETKDMIVKLVASQWTNLKKEIKKHT